MTSGNITLARQGFTRALNSKLRERFSNQLDGTFEAMSVPSGFHWGIQFGPNNYYNENSLNQINLQASKDRDGNLTVGKANFTTLYHDIMSAIVFGFSAADEKALHQAEADAPSQIHQVIVSWEQDFGRITEEQQKSAFPSTKLGYIQLKVQGHWGGDVNNIPPMMQAFKNAYQGYQVSAPVSNRLTTESAQAMVRLNAARANSLTAEEGNGGLQTGAAAYYQPFGPFPTQDDIKRGLQTLSNNLSVELYLSDFSSKDSVLSVEGNAGISIPHLDFMTIDLGGSSQYTVDRYASSGTTLAVSIKYDGVTFLGAPLTDANLSSDLKTGWYANDILVQAIENTKQDKTGYSLQGSQYPVSEYFGAGKKFSRVKTWVLSQQPTISIQFRGADESTIVTDFKEHASLGIALFGIFGIGKVKESYEVRKVESDGLSGCVTVEMGPSKVVGSSGPEDTSTTYVVGGVPSYPPSQT